MTERERLIELLTDTLHEWECDDVQPVTVAQIADHLIDNNVFATPVTEGDSIYIILLGLILPFDVISVSLFRKTLIFKAQHGLNLTWVFKMEDFGKTVFLTREEAEKALEERSGKE